MWDPSLDEGSDWAPGVAAPQAGVRARGGPPAQRAKQVPDAVLRNRVTQRQYLQRKKVLPYPTNRARLASERPRVSAVLQSVLRVLQSAQESAERTLERLCASAAQRVMSAA